MKAAHFLTVSILPTVLLLACACSGISINDGAVHYRAFGESITAGKTLSDPESQAYPGLVAEDRRTALYNYAHEGDQACDLAPRQIFANAESPTIAIHPSYSILIGTNDVDAQGSGAYEAVFTQCLAGAIAWLAIPVEQKVMVGDAGFLATGPGAIDDSDGWRAWTTQGPASTVSFTVTTATDGPIYVWPLIDDASSGTYTFALDGDVLGASATRTNPAMHTGTGTTRSVGFLRLPAIPAGTHVVTLTQTSSGADGIGVIGAGVPAPSSGGAMPIVLAGTIPFQMHTSAASGCQSSDDPCLAYNRDIRQLVGQFSADGLDVRLFDTRQFMHGTSAEMSDAIHPNARGQKELRKAVESVWSISK